MKRLAKAGVVAVGAALVTQAAYADFTANDLYLGFTKSGASSDYIIDLGQASLLTGASSTVDLSGNFSLSTLNSIFGSPTGVSMSVVGGKVANPTTYDFYTTASIDLSSITLNFGSTATYISDISSVPSALPGANSFNLDSSLSYSTYVIANAQGSYYGDSGLDPSSAITTGILTEQLWGSAPNQAFKYLGSFALDTSGASPSLTFTPVPEPSTCALIGGGSLLLLALRRRLTSKSA